MNQVIQSDLFIPYPQKRSPAELPGIFHWHQNGPSRMPPTPAKKSVAWVFCNPDSWQAGLY